MSQTGSDTKEKRPRDCSEGLESFERSIEIVGADMKDGKEKVTKLFKTLKD